MKTAVAAFGVWLGLAGCAQGDTGYMPTGLDPAALSEDDDEAPATDGEAEPEARCEPAGVIVLLDRSDTMRARPDGALPPAGALDQTRWSLAISGIELFVRDIEAAGPVGMALFPRDPGDGCRTVPQLLLDEPAPTNAMCGAAELVVAPHDAAAVEIASALDPNTTRVCASAPLAQAVDDMRAPLSAIAEPGRRPHLVIVTDGDGMCSGDPVGLTQDLVASTDAIVHVVMVGDAVPGSLEDLACAGRSVPGFPAGCTDTGDGRFVADGEDGPARVHLAQDADELAAAFAAIREQLDACG